MDFRNPIPTTREKSLNNCAWGSRWQRVSFGFAKTLTERFATSCLILKWLKFYNRNLNGKKKYRSESIAHWALTSAHGNEDCLTQWNALYPSSEREFGLVCKLKYCFEKSVASNDRNTFFLIRLFGALLAKQLTACSCSCFVWATLLDFVMEPNQAGLSFGDDVKEP